MADELATRVIERHRRRLGRAGAVASRATWTQRTTRRTGRSSTRSSTLLRQLVLPAAAGRGPSTANPSSICARRCCGTARRSPRRGRSGCCRGCCRCCTARFRGRAFWFGLTEPLPARRSSTSWRRSSRLDYVRPMAKNAVHGTPAGHAGGAGADLAQRTDLSTSTRDRRVPAGTWMPRRVVIKAKSSASQASRGTIRRFIVTNMRQPAFPSTRSCATRGRRGTGSRN